MKIEEVNGVYKYFDMNGNEIHEGDFVLMNGEVQEVYLTDENELGTDATNPHWIKIGRAVPCEFGIYPFDTADEPVLAQK